MRVEYKVITVPYRAEFEKKLNEAAAEGWQMHTYRHHIMVDPRYKNDSIRGWSAVMLRDLR